MKKIFALILICFLAEGISAQNYTILGNASSLSGCNCFRLTPNANNQAGAIFQNNTINLNNSFDYTFNVFLGCNGSSGADGIVFVLTSNPNGLGNQGEGMGYAGGNQPFSFAVEFDTWQNGNAGDPSFDHIGINSGGFYNHNVAGPVQASASSAIIDDCQWHTVRIVWDVNSNTFSVYFDGVLRISIVIPNMVGTYFGGNPIVNWGWSGATGGGTNDQQVCVLSTSNWVGGVNYQSCNLTVQFSDISTSNIGSVQSWAWTFGDGGTSTLQNPTHTYPSTGTYNVSLTITDNASCANTFTHPITINPPISMTPTITPPPCNGGSNGGISIVPSGGFGPAAGYGGYMYSWSNNTTQSSLIGASAGTYTLTVTDGVCTSTAQYTINQPPPLTATTSHTDAPCGGNGTATIAISGGTPPYTGVNWAGFPGYTVSLPAGTWIADFHDANGCSALLQYTETIAQLPCGITSSVSKTNVSCFGGNNGTITLTITGSTPPVNVTWSNGATGTSISGLAAGTYTYNYSDGTPSHSFSGSVTITQPGAAMVASLSTVNMSCANTNDGQALASVQSGGTPPYNYAWSGGQPNNPLASPLSAGPVTVTITDATGCTATATGTITGPPTLTLNVTSVDDSCYQSETGSATANVSGGNPPYTYYWSNISSAQTNLSLGIGTYTVTVTDNKGCTITGSATINQPTQFTHTLTSQNINCFGANTGSITVTPSGGTPAYSYTWNPGTASGNNPTGLSAGQYNVTISDSKNCTNVDSVVLTQPAAALNVVTSHTNVTCYNANNGSVTITVSGGTAPYTYQGNPIPPGTTTLNNLPPATYSGTLTDANGCTASVSETITQPQPQSVTVNSTNNTCNGGNNGTASANFINATGSVTYNWSNGQSGANITGLVANTYTVTATDQNQCSLTGSATVTEPAAPVMTVNITDAACFGANGSATANPTGGTTPYTFTWSAGGATTQTASLPAGSYTVTATDASSCNQTAAFSINEPGDMTIQETHTDLDCFGDADGDIQLTVTGGTGPNYTYVWSPNVSTTNLAGLLTAGTYNITVTDQANCNKTISVTLVEPAQPVTLNVQSNNISCYGVSDGAITINASGGTPGYTYTWNPNITATNSASGLGPGTYDITVTDSKNCSVMPSVTISQPNQPLTVTPSHTDLTCFQSNDGTVDATVNGGTFPYFYTWSPNIGSGNTANGLAAGSYALTVTDNNGCTNTASYVLVQPTQVTVSENHINVLCFGDATGSATVNANGGTPGYTYVWSPSVSTTNMASNLTAGGYNVTVTDANNCTALQMVTVTQPPLLTIQATPSAALCNGDATGSITASAAGGVTAYTFSATDGTNNFNSASGLFAALPAGTYTVSVTDNNQCVSSTTAVVTEPAALSNTVNVTNASCYHYTNGVVAVSTTGGVPAFTYLFSTGSANSSGVFGGLGAGTYVVTVTDANGCSVTETATVTEPDSVWVTVTPTPVEVKLGNDLQILLNTNQTGNVTYQWTPAFGLSCYDCVDPVFIGIYSQPYNVVVTNEDGCVGTAQFVVTVIPNYDVFIPNAFTPNGDGENDYWQIFGNLNGIKQFEIMLFNRIGEKVFESNDLNFKWDGHYKGVKVPPGVYVYHAKFVWLNNHSDNKYTGSLTILR
ncbi:MAG: gliding motility-associated C-terminal domain-containing protein [Chitinophagales bacterium]|nr:gliding motility-associated C-terminal domain-containing protein [Chitinophagales bacterium]